MTSRWRFVLVEEQTSLPVRWQPPECPAISSSPPGEIATMALIMATRILGRRGIGPEAWAACYEHDPVAFLIDAVDSPVRLWSEDGELLYQNTAAEGLPALQELGITQPGPLAVELDGESRRRRVLAFRRDGKLYALEIVTQSHGDLR
jgi:hypothetical protein